MNNKGFTVFELLIGFIFLILISYFLLTTTFNARDRQQLTVIKNKLYDIKNNLTHEIEFDLIKYKFIQLEECGPHCYDLTFADDLVKRLIIDIEGNAIQYGDSSYELLEDSYIKIPYNIMAIAINEDYIDRHNSILNIEIPINHYEIKGDFGINIHQPYDSTQVALNLDEIATYIAEELEAMILSGEIDVNTFTKDDLDIIDIDGNKYEGFGISLVNGKAVVTLVKNNYIGENNLNTKIYGVIGHDTTLFRTDDSVNLIAYPTSTYIISDFDYEEIYSEISQETDSYGNVFIKIPKFWIKKTKEEGVWTYQISRTKPNSSYYLPACFYDESSGKVVPYILIGKYEASLSGNKLESKSGQIIQTNKKIAEFRQYARNNNVDGRLGYQLLDIHVIDILQTLFYVEFATLDSQSIMAGLTSVSHSNSYTGATDSVGSPLSSGSPSSNTNGRNPMKYRGIENVWGNTHTFIDGINVNNYQAYVSRNPVTYESDTYDGDYVSLSYVNAMYDGWIKSMGFDLNNPFIQLPIEVIGIGTIFYKDYYWPLSSQRVVVFGGNWNAETYAGISYWAPYFDSDYLSESIGARLIKVPL